MNRSFKLFSVRGIDVRLHITFPLILIWAAIQFGGITGAITGAIFGVIAITILFALVTLHELGHSFAALHYDVPVERIVLSPIGGVAQLRNMPETPWQEFVIAVAGPAVNVIVAVLMLFVALAAGIDVFSPTALLGSVGVLTVPALFTYIFASNILLALFNLIPAFPLDGGRIFRALLAMRFDYVKATTFASTVGRVLAVGMGIYGLISGSIFLAFIAIFIFVAGSQEAGVVRLRHTLRRYNVQQVYSSSVHRLAPSQTLQQAYDMMVFSGQTSFPVTLGENLVGFLSRASVLQALRTHKAYTWIENFMRRDMPTISPYADLFDAQEKMVAERTEALPVVLQGRFLGLITQRQISDMVRWVGKNPSGVVVQSS